MAEPLIISKLTSITSTPLNLVIDKYPRTTFEPATIAKYFWRFEDEPESPFQFLGQQTVGFPFSVPFEGSGREIRISMIGISEAGVASETDPRAGVQTTFTPASSIDTIVTYGGDIVFYDGEIVTYG